MEKYHSGVSGMVDLSCKGSKFPSVLFLPSLNLPGTLKLPPVYSRVPWVITLMPAPFLHHPNLPSIKSPNVSRTLELVETCNRDKSEALPKFSSFPSLPLKPPRAFGIPWTVKASVLFFFFLHPLTFPSLVLLKFKE